MLETVTFSIDDKGTTRFLVNDTTSSFLDETSDVRRASHIEPCNPLLRFAFYALRTLFGERGKVSDWTRSWSCPSQVNLAPVGGPTLGIYTNRQEAIDAEIEWLENNWL